MGVAGCGSPDQMATCPGQKRRPSLSPLRQPLYKARQCQMCKQALALDIKQSVWRTWSLKIMLPVMNTKSSWTKLPKNAQNSVRWTGSSCRGKILLGLVGHSSGSSRIKEQLKHRQH